MGPLLGLLAWVALATGAGGGLELERLQSRGLVLSRPRSYDPIPVRSDEPWRAARWSERLEDAPRRTVRPELSLLELEPVDAQRGADALAAWLAANAPAWRVVPGRALARRGARIGAAHALELVAERASDDDRRRAGWAFTWAGEGATFAWIGFAAREDLERESALWLAAARQTRFVEREEPRLEPGIERLYARGELTETDRRAAVRASLPPGWKASDTPHYLVVDDVDDAELVRRVCRDVELLREELARLFPPAVAEPELAVVRVCKSREEYLVYGGDPRSVGHFNPRTRELVLYDVDGPGKAARDRSQTLLVLYHEAFHQHVLHSTGQLPPHPWFDEGHGDYFSGAEIVGGRVRRIGTHPWRLGRARSAVLEGRALPLERLLAMEQGDYYEDAQERYAQGWSFVYFLRTAGEVRRRREWAGILPTYFETLKSAYAGELGALAGEGEVTRERWEEACRRARAAALERAFAAVDLAELEQAWAGYVRALEER